MVLVAEKSVFDIFCTYRRKSSRRWQIDSWIESRGRRSVFWEYSGTRFDDFVCS